MRSLGTRLGRALVGEGEGGKVRGQTSPESGTFELSPQPFSHKPLISALVVPMPMREQ
jgi:hypothetical protein